MSAQPLSQGCGLRLVDLMNAIENGIQPYPLFFHHTTCDNQWPNVEDSDVKARAELFGQTDTMTLCPDRSLANCPVPYLTAAILPPNVKVQFYARTNSDIQQRVQNQGYYEMNSEIGLEVKGLVPRPTAINASTSMWLIPGFTNYSWVKKSSEPAYANDINIIHNRWNRLPSALPDSSDCIYPEEGVNSAIDSTHDFCPQGCKSYHPTVTSTDINNLWSGKLTTQFPVGNKSKGSMLSCGSVFWPSFTGTVSSDPTGNFMTTTPVTTHNPRDKQINGDTDHSGVLEWKAFTHNDDFEGDPKVWDYCIVREQGGNDNITPNYYAFKSGLASQDTGSINTDDKIWYSNRDCIQNGTNQLSCSADSQQTFSTCYESTGDIPVNGSVGKINITQTQPWLLTQIQACTGVNPLKIANNPINSYGNGTDLCDPIMERACNSTIIQTDPDLSVSCECIVEKQKLQQQFAGLDLPVECFLDICNKDGNGIYHTKQQNQGCNARICEQIFRVHGYDLIANGQQTMKCSGEVYNVNNFVNQVNTTATVGLPTPEIPKAKLHFTPLFYGALGLMLLMGLLLVVWLIRRSILYKRLKSQKKKQLENILEQDLKKLKRV